MIINATFYYRHSRFSMNEWRHTKWRLSYFSNPRLTVHSKTHPCCQTLKTKLYNILLVLQYHRKQLNSTSTRQTTQRDQQEASYSTHPEGGKQLDHAPYDVTSVTCSGLGGHTTGVSFLAINRTKAQLCLNTEQEKMCFPIFDEMSMQKMMVYF